MLSIIICQVSSLGISVVSSLSSTCVCSSSSSSSSESNPLASRPWQGGQGSSSMEHLKQGEKQKKKRGKEEGKRRGEKRRNEREKKRLVWFFLSCCESEKK